MKLRGKILTGFAIVIAIFAALCVFLIVRINKVSTSSLALQKKAPQFDQVVQSIDSLKIEVFPIFKKATQLLKSLEIVKGAFMTSIEDEDFDLIDLSIDGAEEFFQNIQELQAVLNESDAQHIKEIEILFQSYLTDGKKVVKKFLKGDAVDLSLLGRMTDELTQKIEALHKEKEESFFLGMDNVSSLNREFKDDLFLTTSTINTQLKNLIAIIPAISALALVIGIFVAVLLTKFALLNPINKVINRMRDIAEGEGDLTQRLEIEAKDEIGELAKWFNTFVDKLHSVILKVSEVTDQVASSAIEMSATADQAARGAERQTDRTTQVVTSMDEMSSTVMEVARNSTDASDLAQKAMNTASSGGQVVSRAVNGMKQIEITVKESATIIGALGESSQHIGEIINVINDIADQTNLLALNAAIEAARAGEHGRGFAVVADEVRKLAERTTKATKEIVVMIQSIQSSTNEAVSSMEKGTKEVSVGVDLINQTGKSLEEIVSMVKTVSGKVSEIAIAAEEQSSTTETISQNTESVMQVARELTTSAEQSSKAAKDLNQLFEELKKKIDQFRL